MARNRFRIRRHRNTGDAAYVELFDFPDKLPFRSGGSVVVIHHLFENWNQVVFPTDEYLGPRIKLDFDPEKRAMGFETLYPFEYAREDDELDEDHAEGYYDEPEGYVFSESEVDGYNEKSRMYMRQFEGQPNLLYIELFDHPHKPGVITVEKSMLLHEIVQGYRGPNFTVQFDAENRAVGIEVVYP